MSVSSVLVFLASQGAPRLSSRVLASSGYSRNLNRFGPPEGFGVWGVETAHRQEDAWQPIVETAKHGRPRADVVALYKALAPFAGRSMSILEAGCGGGHNSELIASRYPDFHYSGIDISPSMIDVARSKYPERNFAIDSAYELVGADTSVDVVLDGVALIHMTNWRTALHEYARVSRGCVILHGLTLTDAAATTPFVKYAYGQPTLELVFNRKDVESQCASLGLTRTASFGGLAYDLHRYLGIPSVSETWVLSAADAG